MLPRRKSHKVIVSVIFLLLLLGQYLITTFKKPETPQVNGVQTQSIEQSSARVTKVVDGDTIDISIDGKKEKVRIIGINTPETVDPRKPVECFGKEASNKAKELFASSSAVKVERDPSQDNQDKYQRLLRYVYLSDGTDFGKKMIEEGYANEYTYDIPYGKQKEYKQAQKNAQENKRGLWADNACT